MLIARESLIIIIILNKAYLFLYFRSSKKRRRIDAKQQRTHPSSHPKASLKQTRNRSEGSTYTAQHHNTPTTPPPPSESSKVTTPAVEPVVVVMSENEEEEEEEGEEDSHLYGISYIKFESEIEVMKETLNSFSSSMTRISNTLLGVSEQLVKCLAEQVIFISKTSVLPTVTDQELLNIPDPSPLIDALLLENSKEKNVFRSHPITIEPTSTPTTLTTDSITLTQQPPLCKVPPISTYKQTNRNHIPIKFLECNMKTVPPFIHPTHTPTPIPAPAHTHTPTPTPSTSKAAILNVPNISVNEYHKALLSGIDGITKSTPNTTQHSVGIFFF